MLSKYIRDILAISIEPDQIIIKSLYTDVEIEDRPVIAVNEKLKAVAIGRKAELLKKQSPVHSLALINPFSHPRVAVTDTELASCLLRLLIERFYQRSFLLPRLTLVVYPPTKWRADLTSLEHSAFADMAHKAGGREVLAIPTDIKLTVKDIKELRKSPLDEFSPLLHEETRYTQK